MRKITLALVLAVWVMSGVGCAMPTADYREFVAHQPRSILVLPPLNNSANVRASDAFLSSVTEPLAECGYYVYPVAVIDRLFKDNGVPTPGDMHSVSLKKIDEIIGPDAVMYITIKKWTTTYLVIDSSTIVEIAYKVVDVRTERVLWQWSGEARISSSAGQSDIIAMTISAAVHAVASAASDGKAERDAAIMCNAMTFNSPNHGLPRGARSPGFEKDQKRIQKMIAKQDAKQQADAAKGKS
ncbi:MAG: DUF799 family lipoprotein [Phycisphaeraceae bacterium]|nr:DUF799 family lipoprotein [Phycisphaeraceae bacterium]